MHPGLSRVTSSTLVDCRATRVQRPDQHVPQHVQQFFQQLQQQSQQQ